MPHFEIKLYEGKSDDEKRALADAVIKAAQAQIGYGSASYSVVIKDYSPEEWKTTVYPKDIMGNQDVLYKKPGYEM